MRAVVGGLLVLGVAVFAGWLLAFIIASATGSDGLALVPLVGLPALATFGWLYRAPD